MGGVVSACEQVRTFPLRCIASSSVFVASRMYISYDKLLLVGLLLVIA